MTAGPIGMAQQDRAERQIYENELQRILASSNKRGLVPRVIGSLAFQNHCQEYGYIQEVMGRSYTDIDFAAYRRDTKASNSLHTKLGYLENQEVFIFSGGNRSIFTNEKLDFCQQVSWIDRLEIDSPTIPLAELFLEKVKRVTQDYQKLDGEQKGLISKNIDETLSRIQLKPKPWKWRMRAKVGDRIQWYKDVDEV